MKWTSAPGSMRWSPTACGTKLGFSPETTLHDVRWGRWYKGNGINDFVWVLEISGSVPPAHLVGGFAGASSERQPAMYFPKGGGSIKGVSKPGWVVWSRVFVEGGKLNCDLGLGEAVELPRSRNGRALAPDDP